jgi:UDP-glucose 4-epimerase
MVNVVDEGFYYKIQGKKNYLNHDKYFTQGDLPLDKSAEYTSHNTKRLSIKEIKKILLKEVYIKNKIND